MKREEAEALRAREQNNDIPGYDSSGVLTPPVNDEDWRNSTNITTRKKKKKERNAKKLVSNYKDVIVVHNTNVKHLDDDKDIDEHEIDWLRLVYSLF